MSRVIPSGLLAVLESDAMSLAICVKLTRADGTVLGFTSSNMPVSFGSVTYLPTSSLSPDSIKFTHSTYVDNSTVRGVLDDSRITSEDVMSGKYSNCKILMYMCDMNDPGLGQVLLFSGLLGQITVNNGRFDAEIRSQMSLLKQTVSESTSAACRVRALGDRQCGVNVAAISLSGKVVSVSSQLNFVFSSTTNPTAYFDFGVLTCTSGANVGISREIRKHTKVATTAVIIPREAFPYTVADGDVFTLKPGCDRTFATCVSKFSNQANFRGEPHLPGNDKLNQIARSTR